MEFSGTITETIDRRGARTYIEVKYGNDFVTITVPSILSDAFRKGETVVIHVHNELDRRPDVCKSLPTFEHMRSIQPDIL